jgi:hypothetical protein
MAQVGYRMFKTYNIAVDKAQDVLTHMCHLYEVSEEKSRSRRSSFSAAGREVQRRSVSRVARV